MLSIETCEKILNQKGKKYSSDQVKVIRETLYFLAHLSFENHLTNEKSSNLHKSVDR
jgi:hypothetical protein